MFGEAMVSSVTGSKSVPPKRDYVHLDNGNRPGIVTVVDIQNIHNDHVSILSDISLNSLCWIHFSIYNHFACSMYNYFLISLGVEWNQGNKSVFFYKTYKFAVCFCAIFLFFL